MTKEDRIKVITDSPSLYGNKCSQLFIKYQAQNYLLDEKTRSSIEFEAGLL
jgi:hypothetical protein